MNAKRNGKSAQASRTYTIAEARNALGHLVHRSEQGPIELTRRGQAVAVILSQAEYERLTAQGPSFMERMCRLREKYQDVIEEANLPEVFEQARDRSPGREVKLY